MVGKDGSKVVYPGAWADAPGAKSEPTFDAVSAAALMNRKLEPLLWAVRDLIPEGLTLLTGKPKMGKSWLVLELAVAVAKGGRFLGSLEVERGRVLYLALEDSFRRMQDRLRTVLEGSPPPENLDIVIRSKPLNAEGLDALRVYVGDHLDLRVIVIDTFAAAFAARDAGRSNFKTEYDTLTPLQKLANVYGIAIVLVHHNRKMDSDDPMDLVSGTTGLTAAADTCLVLMRGRGKADAVLHVFSREVRERELALDFREGRWALLGDAAEVHRSNAQRRILDALRDSPEPMKPKEIAEETGINAAKVRTYLTRLCRAGIVKKAGSAVYTLSERCAVAPVAEPP